MILNLTKISQVSKITVCTFLLLVVISCDEKNVEKNDVKEEFYPNGKLKRKYSLINGKITGKVYYYKEQGYLSSILNCVDGVPEGDAERFYRNGKTKEKYYCSNGKGNGKTMLYDSLGNIQSIGKYINGELCGMFYDYYPNGKMKKVSLLFNGSTQYDGTYNEDGTYSSDWYYIDIKQQDTIKKGNSFNAQIFIKEPKNNVKIKEFILTKTIPSDTSWVSDTIKIIKPTSDTVLEYNTTPEQSGNCHWIGILKVEHEFKGKTITNIFRVKEQFFVK